MEPSSVPVSALTRDCLIHIFSLLEADDLRQVSQVNEAWNEAADTPWLWRRLCLERWIFCNLSKVDDGINSWKKYYLHRSKIEQRMASGRGRADYTCTTFRGHSGRITGLQYCSNPDNQFEARAWKSVVCTTSTDCTLRAWSIQEGKQLWSTPVQEEPLVKLSTLPQQGLVITADAKGNIKLWNGQTGEELAVFATSCTICNLVTYNMEDQHCLTVLRTEYLMDCLDDDRLPVDALYVNNCYTACWLPKAPSRVVTVTNNNAMVSQKSIITLNVCQKRKHKPEIQGEQVGSFTYEEAGRNDILIEGHGSNTIIIAHNTKMKLFSIDGVHLASFHDHNGTISGISLDPFRVVTASMDLSLRVYTWKRQSNKCLHLESNYHLLGGSHMKSRGFTSVVCDYVSIVGAVETKDGKDVLKAYNFSM
ncbi:F-box/WD repeat-containing protein 12 isoform X2 [Mobula hypostoma]|uniref:F-box/WD repeat-containing protein 12 isoform X2 n=1 Tax=Mobula hypostoma TaxID=723540 RepID=UPI002FC2ABCC